MFLIRSLSWFCCSLHNVRFFSPWLLLRFCSVHSFGQFDYDMTVVSKAVFFFGSFAWSSLTILDLWINSASSLGKFQPFCLQICYSVSAPHLPVVSILVYILALLKSFVAYHVFNFRFTSLSFYTVSICH